MPSGRRRNCRRALPTEPLGLSNHLLKENLTASFLSEVQFLQMESVGTCFCSLLRSGRKVQRVPWRLGLRLLFAPNPKSFLVAQTMCESVVMIDALRNGLLGRCGFHRTPQPADSSSDIRHFFVRGGGVLPHPPAALAHAVAGQNRRRAATARTGRGRLVTPGAGLATALGTSCTDPTAHSCATLPASPRLRMEIGRRPAVCAGPARTRCLPPPLPRHQHSPPADGSLHMGR